MKKIYLTILGITALTSSFAQGIPVEKHAEEKLIIDGDYNVKTKTSTPSKALGAVVWSDDFSNPATWTINNNGQSASGFGWEIGTVNKSWWFTNPSRKDSINSSTKSNNYAQVNNGVYTSALVGTQALNVTYSMTTATPIDIQTLANSDTVFLNFQQFGALFNDDQQVQISTNGTNYVTVYTNNNRVKFLGSNPTAVYSNPENISVNLTKFIEENAGSVYIRFIWTSGIPSDQTKPAWTTFGWYIDDINISKLPDNNLTLVKPFAVAGSQKLVYSKIPVNQISPITFTGRILNNGSADQTAVNLEAVVNGGSPYSGTSQSISTLDSADFTTSVFTPTGTIATYNYTFTAIGNTEDLPIDNSATGSLKITKSEYRVDNGVVTGGFSNVGSQPNGALKIGNLFEIFKSDKIDSMYITLTTSSTNIGQEFWGEIWIKNGDNYQYLNSTDYVDINAQNNGTTAKLKLQSITNVSAGDILLVMACHSGGTVPVRFAMAQDLPAGSVWGIKQGGTPNDLFELSNPAALMVGLSLNQDASIKENNKSISISNIFPNPTNGSTSINYSLENASEVSINVLDIAGKLVYSSDEGTQVSGKHTSIIDASAFNTGVYYVTIITNDSQVTQKLIKK